MAQSRAPILKPNPDVRICPSWGERKGKCGTVLARYTNVVYMPPVMSSRTKI